MAYMDPSALDELLSFSLGSILLERFQEDELLAAAIARAQTEALKTLEDIRLILNSSLEDPECFDRIELIVEAMENHKIPIYRHDW